MKTCLIVTGLAVLLVAASPARAWLDPVESFHAITGEEDCKFVPSPPDDVMEPLWTSGANSSREFITDGSMGPDSDSPPVMTGKSPAPVDWAYGKESWAGDSYDLAQDTAKKSQGTSSLRVDPSGGWYCDIYIVRALPTVPGRQYTFSFDLALEAGLLGGQAPGQQTGEDHQTSVTWQVRNTVENVLETMSLGLMSPAAIADTEDYPGHERQSTWIGDPADWDGEFHTHSTTFTAEGDVAVFALKLRAHGASDDAGMNLDNLVLVPEPASLVLLALGGLTVLRRRSR